jgi:hypothetical protein
MMASPSQPVSRLIALPVVVVYLLAVSMTLTSTQVPPLRISKGPSSSPTKMASSIPRALTELAPTEKRRNSPSFNQPSKVGLIPDLHCTSNIHILILTTEDGSQRGFFSIPIISLQCLDWRLVTTTLLAGS